MFEIFTGPFETILVTAFLDLLTTLDFGFDTFFFALAVFGWLAAFFHTISQNHCLPGRVLFC
ncbi:MAG: hypothetical protein CMM76_07000 [Rhodospirillaceae bacterium]|nr:hypothetical protein [Rhodospirillaceae bacterium]